MSDDIAGSPMQDTEKAAARCTECGNIYSVKVRDDGTVHVIGNAGACQCGSTEFTVLDANNVGEPAT